MIYSNFRVVLKIFWVDNRYRARLIVIILQLKCNIITIDSLMIKTKTLNLADILRLKKDVLWGKYYFAQFEDNKLIDSIIFFHPFANKNLIEIYRIEKRDQNFLNEFTREYSKKKKIKYFIRELDEASQVTDIDFMQSCGFIRYNRNYCFEFKSTNLNARTNHQPMIYCRPAEFEDLDQIIDLDMNSQLIEYRDYLVKEKRFLKNNIENIYVFTQPSNLNQIEAFAYKKYPDQLTTFELVLHPRHNDILLPCIDAFGEKYILFEKNADEFNFIINENQKEKIDELKNSFNLIWSTQLMLIEGAPRAKSKKIISDFAIRKTPASAN
jgi:hypothetical protein